MFNYLLYRLGQAIVLVLPLRLAYSLAVFLSSLYYFFAFIDRSRVSENLKAVFPQKNLSEINAIRLKIFHNFAKYLVDFFRLNKIDMAYVKKNVRLKNEYYIKESLAEGNGAILLTAHLGNWELGGVVISMLGYPLLTVALPHKSRKVNDFFDAQRESNGERVLPLGKAAKGCLRALRNNELLGLVGDRDFVGKGLAVEFFGKKTIFPLGPAFFSLQTKAKIIPTFTLRNPDDSFDIVMSKPFEYAPCGDNKKDLREIINLYKAVFEDYIQRYPEQWYMFRRFWKE